MSPALRRALMPWWTAKCLVSSEMGESRPEPLMLEDFNVEEDNVMVIDHRRGM